MDLRSPGAQATIHNNQPPAAGRRRMRGPRAQAGTTRGFHFSHTFQHGAKPLQFGPHDTRLLGALQRRLEFRLFRDAQLAVELFVDQIDNALFQHGYVPFSRHRARPNGPSSTGAPYTTWISPFFPGFPGPG